MKEDKDNPLALSSKKPCQGQTDYGQELARLRADLEAEKNRSQRARGQLAVELRRLREEAEKEQQRAVRELAAKRGCQKDRFGKLLAEEVNSKGRQHSKVESTGKKAFCFCSGQTYTKLEQLLLTLYEKINGEQATYKLHHRQEFELEKAIFLSHLLEAHARLLQGTQKAGHPSYVFKNLLRKPAQEEGSNACQTRPLRTSSRASLHRSQSASHSPKRKAKQDRWKPSSGRDSCAVDPRTTAAVVDTCQLSSPRICHPHNIPHAGWDDQPSHCATESSRSDESMATKCMERNMEVSRFILLY